MKPSQFRRIEKTALQQRTKFKQILKDAESLGNLTLKERIQSNLNNLISTMRNLKKN